MENRSDRDRRKAARHYADKRIGIAVQQNFLADLRGISSEAAAPQTVTDDGDALASCGAVFFGEIAAERRLDAEHAEVARRDGRAAQMLGARSGGEVVADGGVRGHVLEGLAVVLEALPLARVETHFVGGLFVGLGELDDAIRLGKWERPEKDAVDDREDRGVCTDAES